MHPFVRVLALAGIAATFLACGGPDRSAEQTESPFEKAAAERRRVTAERERIIAELADVYGARIDWADELEQAAPLSIEIERVLAPPESRPIVLLGNVYDIRSLSEGYLLTALTPQPAEFIFTASDSEHVEALQVVAYVTCDAEQVEALSKRVAETQTFPPWAFVIAVTSARKSDWNTGARWRETEERDGDVYISYEIAETDPVIVLRGNLIAAAELPVPDSSIPLVNSPFVDYLEMRNMGLAPRLGEEQ